MYNIKDKIEDMRSKEKSVEYSEKEKSNMEIKDAQKKKAELFINMGMITYQKIRERSIDDIDFDDLCREILELDKIVYENALNAEELNNKKRIVVCSCGHEVDIDGKYCSECGEKIELLIQKLDTIDCTRCGNNIEIDFNFCVCCGNKVN
ncbi:MAG: zinc ribbon domain-containing protein [Romboutsia sp.]